MPKRYISAAWRAPLCRGEERPRSVTALAPHRERRTVVIMGVVAVSRVPLVDGFCVRGYVVEGQAMNSAVDGGSGAPTSALRGCPRRSADIVAKRRRVRLPGVTYGQAMGGCCRAWIAEPSRYLPLRIRPRQCHPAGGPPRRSGAWRPTGDPLGSSGDVVVRSLDSNSSCAPKRDRAPELVTAGLTVAMDRGSGRPDTTVPPHGPNIG